MVKGKSGGREREREEAGGFEHLQIQCLFSIESPLALLWERTFFSVRIEGPSNTRLVAEMIQCCMMY